MCIPPILCVVGGRGSGKTTLLKRLIPALSAAGIKASIVKKTKSVREREGEGKGKRSSSNSSAGAVRCVRHRSDLRNHGVCPSNIGRCVVAANSGRNHGTTHLLDLAAQIGAECDLLLADGFDGTGFDKVLILPAGASHSPACEPGSAAVVVRGIGPEDTAALTGWVRRWLDRRRRLGRGVMGAVLTGGRSRRMGRDKAGMRVGGRLVLPHLVELVAARTGEVWTIGRKRGIRTFYPPFSFLPQCVRWHRDLRVNCGPLGGIATALHVAGAAGRQAVLAVACDMPRLTGEVLDFLLEARRRDRPATAIRNPSSGRIEPLVAVYEVSSLAEIERSLDAGDLSVTGLLERIGAHIVESPTAWADRLVNVNTPGELKGLDKI